MDRRSVLASWALLAIPGAAFAQGMEYPRPGSTIRYVVPFPPGGLTDVMARMVAQQLGARWKVNVVVENKPGGGGMIGADLVAKAPPDGQTLLAVTMTHAINASLFKGRAPYDFERDLKPVALLAGSSMLIVVPATSPIRDLNHLVAEAKIRTLNAGSSGNGTAPHLTLELFNDLHKTRIQHVPYKGGAPSITDLLGGQLDVIFSNFPESVAHVKSGKLRALAITSAQRHAQLPDVPTTAEFGMPKLTVENWTAIMAPAAMPDAAVRTLSDAVLQVMAAPDMEERARSQGFRVDARGAAEFAAFSHSEVQRWAAIVKAANIRPE